MLQNMVRIVRQRSVSQTHRLLCSDSFKHNYNQTQAGKILGVINSETELEKYLISKQRIKKIELRKQRIGEFKSLEQVLELDGFGIKVLEKFCDSILQVDNENNSPSNGEEKSEAISKKQSYVTPHLLEHVRKTTSTCVALNIGLNSIAWSKFRLHYNRDSSQLRYVEVEDWNSYEIPDDKKLHLSELINIAIYVNKKIPQGDVYVMESLPTAQQAKQPGNPIQVNVNVQRSQLVAMASALLANRSSDYAEEIEELDEKDDDKLIHLAKKMAINQHVFFLRQFLASRLYRVYVGNEKVSTENAVENLLRYNYNEEDCEANLESNLAVTNERNLHVPHQFREIYDQANRMRREYLGQSFLVGMTFIKLCLLKCSKSLQQLNKRGGGSSL